MNTYPLDTPPLSQASTTRRHFVIGSTANSAAVLIAAVAALATPLFSPHAHAQTLSLAGSLLIYRANARPSPAVGYKVYLYSKQSGWSRASYTDSSGRYAHYGVVPGKYLLQIRDSQNAVKWQQDVIVGGGITEVPLVVLPKA